MRSEELSRTGKEKPIFSRASKPQIFREKLTGNVGCFTLPLFFFFKEHRLHCLVENVNGENHEAEKKKKTTEEKEIDTFRKNRSDHRDDLFAKEEKGRYNRKALSSLARENEGNTGNKGE